MIMYGKKVMDHFMNPRNVGEIKDADGVGEVGNPTCLTPDSLVHVNSNIQTIDSMSVGKRVLGHDGMYHKVRKIFIRSYKGDLYKIRVGNLGTIQITPEHLILGLKIASKQHKFLAAKKQVLDWH